MKTRAVCNQSYRINVAIKELEMAAACKVSECSMGSIGRPCTMCLSIGDCPSDGHACGELVIKDNF